MTTQQRWKSKFQIKKDSWVFVPTDDTVQYGLDIKVSIEKKWQPPIHYYHLIGGGHIKALQQHLKHKQFVHLDIQNFFGSINKTRITRCLNDFFSYAKAREIARQSTVRCPDSVEKKYILPFGFVQSPLIASVCLSKSALGNRLREISKRKEFAVSVYMDDIILSSDSTAALNEQLDIIEKTAIRSNFPLNKTKQEGPSASITVFNIYMAHNSLRLTDERLTTFEDIYINSDNEHQKAGIYHYIRSVNKGQAAAL